MNKKSRIITILSISLFAVAVVCCLYFCKDYFAATTEIAEYTEIQKTYTSVVSEETTPVSGIDGMIEAVGQPRVSVDFDGLCRENPDTVGYVTIPGTPVNYPVVQGISNEEYLEKSFSGERSSAGAVFADAKNDMVALDQNTVLYAHNMGNGRTDMFSTLINYNEPAYYTSHQYIQFDTIGTQHSWWKIFAVIHHDVRSEEFNYLKLVFESQNEFMGWVNTARNLSLYETEVEINENDSVLTLSTCNRGYRGQYGRQLILAVKMES